MSETLPETTAPADGLEDWVAVVGEAAAEARAHGDWPAFEAWMAARLADAPPPAFLPAEALAGTDGRRVALALARALWRVLPLAASDYRGQPLPEPGRNEPCYCGSGEKYKHCCERLYRAAEAGVNPEYAWDAMLPTIEPDVVPRLVAAGRVPLWPLGEYALDLADDDELEAAAACLAPAFATPLRYVDEEAAELLAMLAGLYEDLGDFEAQDELLATVSLEAPRSPARAESRFILAGIAANEGEWDEAFELLQAAVDDAPDDPRFGVLDLRLLVATGQLDLARKSAADWLELLRSLPPAPGEEDAAAEAELARLYEDATRDPAGTLLAATLAELPDADREFLLALDAALARPLPDYALAPLDGPPSGAIPAEAPVLLVTPPPLEDFEREWRRAFPLAKPLGDGDEPPDAADPWSVDGWRELLAERPEGYDSLWVLDDLATAIALYEFPGVVTWTRRYREAVLRRADAIVTAALAGRDPATLADCPENRPALRSRRRLTAL